MVLPQINYLQIIAYHKFCVCFKTNGYSKNLGTIVHNIYLMIFRFVKQILKLFNKLVIVCYCTLLDVIGYIARLTKLYYFVSCIVEEIFVLFVCRCRFVVVNTSKNYFINKAYCLEYLSQILLAHI